MFYSSSLKNVVYLVKQYKGNLKTAAFSLTSIRHLVSFKTLNKMEIGGQQEFGLQGFTLNIRI